MGTIPVPDVPARGVNFPPKRSTKLLWDCGTIVSCSLRLSKPSTLKHRKLSRPLKPWDYYSSQCEPALDLQCGEVSSAKKNLSQLMYLGAPRADCGVITQGYSPDGTVPSEFFRSCCFELSCCSWNPIGAVQVSPDNNSSCQQLFRPSNRKSKVCTISNAPSSDPLRRSLGQYRE